MLIHNVASTRVKRKAFSVANGDYSDFDAIDIDITDDDGRVLQITLFVKPSLVLDGISETPADPATVPYTSDEQIGCEAAFVDAAQADY